MRVFRTIECSFSYFISHNIDYSLCINLYHNSTSKYRQISWMKGWKQDWTKCIYVNVNIKLELSRYFNSLSKGDRRPFFLNSENIFLDCFKYPRHSIFTQNARPVGVSSRCEYCSLIAKQYNSILPFWIWEFIDTV